MKNIYIYITMALSIISGNAQSWKVLTPFNTNNTINDMETTLDGKLHVFASGYRTYNTTDGINWKPFSNNGGFGQNATDLQMLDNNLGYAINSNGVLLKTIDGWQTITYINYGTSLNYNNLFFVNENVGFISGYGGNIKKTIDGGVNWTWISPSSFFTGGVNIKDMHFINEQVGFLVDDDGRLFKTYNQGTTWTMFQLQTSSYDLYKILFINENIGFAAGSSGIYRTVDQGQTWVLTTINNMYTIKDIRFKNGILYMVGSSRRFVRSTNLGVSWETPQIVSVPGVTSILDNNNQLNAIGFLGNDIVVAGEKGYIFKANNPAGTSWSLLYKSIEGGMSVRDLQFVNNNKGFLICGSVSLNANYYTVDGGYNWELKGIGSGSGTSRSMDMKSDGRGLMVGSGGYSLTNDYGQTWTGMGPIQPATAYTKSWLKENGDIFIGTNPGTSQTDAMIRHSGNTWSQFIGMYQIGEIKFANEQIGFAGVGNINYGAKLWKTVDGGATWIELNNYTGGTVKKIQIINPLKIYVTGITGNIQVTNDGGETWNNSNTFPSKFHFFDDFNGYGMFSDINSVYKTTDGGQTWQVIIENATSFCGTGTLSFFPDRILSINGELLVCVLDIEPSLQVNLNVYEPTYNKQVSVYPNPTKDVLNISEFAKSISVSDISGKLLGTHFYVNQLDISNYESGIYFLSIISDSGIKQTVKIVKE